MLKFDLSLVLSCALLFVAYSVSCEVLLPEPVTSGEIAIIKEIDGTLWLAGHGGLYRESKGRIKRVADLEVEDLLVHDGEIYLLTVNDRSSPNLLMWDEVSKSLMPPAFLRDAGEMNITALEIYRDDLWLGTERRGLVRVVVGGVLEEVQEAGIRGFRGGVRYLEVLEDRLWIIDQQGAAFWMHGDTYPDVTKLQYQDSNRNRVAAKIVRAGGEYWVVSYLKERDGAMPDTVLKVEGDYAVSEPLVSDLDVISVQDSSQHGMLILATSGLYRLDSEKKELQQIVSAGEGLDAFTANLVIEVGTEFWLGATDGIFKVEPESHSLIEFTDRSLSKSEELNVKALHPLEREVWIGTRSAGAYRLYLDIGIVGELSTTQLWSGARPINFGNNLKVSKVEYSGEVGQSEKEAKWRWCPRAHEGRESGANEEGALDSFRDECRPIDSSYTLSDSILSFFWYEVSFIFEDAIGNRSTVHHREVRQVPPVLGIVGILVIVVLVLALGLSFRRYSVQKEKGKRDERTGLPWYGNPEVSNDIRRLFAKVERQRRSWTVLFIDIDDFGLINKKYGHAMGDKILKYLGEIISDNCRKPRKFRVGGDHPIRWGGEEFFILFIDLKGQDSLEAAERLRKSIKSEVGKRSPDAGPKEVTASMGFIDSTTAGGGGIGFDEAVRKADEALQKAKAAGKDRVVRASEVRGGK